MNIPTSQQCLELFDQYQVPGTVKAHCQAVHNTASFLAQQLVAKGYPLQLSIVQAFSLLHDFMKAVVLERLTDPPYNYVPTLQETQIHQQLRKKYAGMSETKVAYLILKEKYPEFAQLFMELDELTRDPRAQVHEETRFIHYIDWRVLGNKVVPLSERIAYIYERYGFWIRKKNIDWEATKQEQQDYETKIFKYLPFTPAELGKNIQSKESKA